MRLSFLAIFGGTLLSLFSDAYRIPMRASMEVDRRSVMGSLGCLAGALTCWTPEPASAAIGLTREYIDPDLRFQLKYPVEWFLSKREASAPAFTERPSSTVLVIADYSTGAIASVVKTSLSPLIREGMGMPSNMGTSISINKFEELLDGKGVATLLVRDRDGQLKSSFDGLQEGEGTKKDNRFLSTVLDCEVEGRRMDFAVTTPVQRVRNYKGTNTARAPSDVFMMATPWIADATPKPSPRLVRQQVDERRSKAKSYLLDDTTVLTLWVTAEQKSWENEETALQAMLDSFQVSQSFRSLFKGFMR